MAVSEHRQLQFDFDELVRRLADRLDDRGRFPLGAERLLRALVRAGLDERALPCAAAIVLELDRPRTPA